MVDCRPRGARRRRIVRLPAGADGSRHSARGCASAAQRPPAGPAAGATALSDVCRRVRPSAAGHCAAPGWRGERARHARIAAELKTGSAAGRSSPAAVASVVLVGPRALVRRARAPIQPSAGRAGRVGRAACTRNCESRGPPLPGRRAGRATPARAAAPPSMRERRWPPRGRRRRDLPSARHHAPPWRRSAGRTGPNGGASGHAGGRCRPPRSRHRSRPRTARSGAPGQLGRRPAPSVQPSATATPPSLDASPMRADCREAAPGGRGSDRPQRDGDEAPTVAAASVKRRRRVDDARTIRPIGGEACGDCSEAHRCGRATRRTTCRAGSGATTASITSCMVSLFQLRPSPRQGAGSIIRPARRVSDNRRGPLPSFTTTHRHAGRGRMLDPQPWSGCTISIRAAQSRLVERVSRRSRTRSGASSAIAAARAGARLSRRAAPCRAHPEVFFGEHRRHQVVEALCRNGVHDPDGQTDGMADRTHALCAEIDAVLAALKPDLPHERQRQPRPRRSAWPPACSSSTTTR